MWRGAPTFSMLPSELVWKISQFCGICEQLKMKLTCCQWNNVVEIDFGPNGENIRNALCRALAPKINMIEVDFGRRPNGENIRDALYRARAPKIYRAPDIINRKNEDRRNVYVTAAGQGNLRFVDYFLTLDSICINPAIFWTGLLAAGSNGQVEVANRILQRASTFTWKSTPLKSLTEEEEFQSVGSAYLFDAMTNAAIKGHANFIKAFISNRRLIGDQQLLTLFEHARMREHYLEIITDLPMIMTEEIKRRKL